MSDISNSSSIDKLIKAQELLKEYCDEIKCKDCAIKCICDVCDNADDYFETLPIEIEFCITELMKGEKK